MAFIQFQKCLTDPKQLLKLVILVICVCITIYQLAQCIQRLNHPPVSTYYNFQLNESITYPHITICREKPYKTHLFPNYDLELSITDIKMKKFAETFPYNKTTISEFLQDVTYRANETIIFYSFQGPGFQVQDESDAMTIEENYILELGRCQTFIPKKLFYTNTSVTSNLFYLKHNSAEKVKQFYSLSNQYGFKMYIHDASEFPSGFRNEQGTFIDNVFIETNEEMQVSISVEFYHKISTSDRPCIDLPDYSYSRCLETCVHNQLAAMHQCTLPWLRNLNQTYPECNNAESVGKIITLLQAERKALLQDCNCQISCNTAIYTTTVQSRRDLVAMSGIIMSNIAFTFNSNVIRSMSEVITYNWNSFVSDIGGSLGFLLGLSVIGAIAVIEEILKIMFCKRKDAQNGIGEEEFEKNGAGQDQDEGATDISMEKSDGGVTNTNSNELRNFVEFLSYYDNFEKSDEGNKY